MKIHFFPSLAAAILFASSASASVIYTFTGSGFGGPESFTLSAPTFVTADTTFAGFSLQSCMIQADACSSVAILSSGPGDALNHPEIDIVAQISGNTTSYFFPFGAFQATGTYSAIATNPANLTVTSIATATPEPGSLALGALALAMLFAAQNQFLRFRLQ